VKAISWWMLHFKLPLARVLLLLPLEISLRNQTRQAFISDHKCCRINSIFAGSKWWDFLHWKVFQKTRINVVDFGGGVGWIPLFPIIKHPDTWNREKPIFKIISSSEVLRCNRLMTVHFFMVANQISQWSNHLEINWVS